MLNYKRIIVLAFSFIMLLLPIVAVATGWQWIASQRVYGLIKEGSGLWLVDVRSGGAFEQGHMEGAVHIPADILATKRLPKGKLYVVVDDSLGLRKGREAAEALLKNGQEKVFLLDGGISAWQAEGYQMAGKAIGRSFHSVMPDEIKWAQENHVPMRIFDLRDDGERAQGPVAKAEPVDGKSVVEKLQKLKGMLMQKKGLFAKLEKPATVIVVFPTGTDPRPALDHSLREVPGEVRYLEGGYAAWAANPEKSLATQGTCPTCPGSKAGGTK